MSNPKNPDRLYDIRTLDGFIANGKLKPSDVEKHLKSLPDEEGNYEIVVMEEDETEE
jgi:hypothetical protein